MFSHMDLETTRKFIAQYMPDIDLDTNDVQKISREVTDKCIHVMQKEIFGEDGKPDYRKIESERDDEKRTATKKSYATERAWYKKMMAHWFNADPEWLKKASYSDITAAFRSGVVNSIFANLDSLH